MQHVPYTILTIRLQKREQSLDDIHGISDVIVEEPQLCTSQNGRDGNGTLKKLTNERKDACKQAEAQNKEHVTCDTFRLKLLAARLMDRFFDEKIEAVWTQQKLTMESKLWDPDKDDQKFLQSGVNQILPQ
jgi:hypothetical protein